MQGLTFTFLASGCASFANFFFRKNSVSNFSVNTNFYLFIYFIFSFFISIAIHPEIIFYSPNLIMTGTGVIVGMLNIGLMLVTARALQLGPAGLTFAFQNASAIFPGVLLFLLFGSSFGFSVTMLQIAGLLLVLFGLYWGCRNEKQDGLSLKWLKYALSCFAIQVFALSLIQARCLLFDCSQFNVVSGDDIWFMPAQFGTAAILQGFLCWLEQKKMGKREAVFGICAGVANGAATCFLLIATKTALPFEKTILFPCFSVSTIILCNLWASKFYGEKFNAVTNIICTIGIVISSIH